MMKGKNHPNPTHLQNLFDITRITHNQLIWQGHGEQISTDICLKAVCLTSSPKSDIVLHLSLYHIYTS